MVTFVNTLAIISHVITGLISSGSGGRFLRLKKPSPYENIKEACSGFVVIFDLEHIIRKVK